MWVLIAHFTVYGASVAWDEFAGVFDTPQIAMDQFDPADYSWMQDIHGNWVTEDLEAGSGIRRSYTLSPIETNTVISIIGDENLRRLKAVK